MQDTIIIYACVCCGLYGCISVYMVMLNCVVLLVSTIEGFIHVFVCV